MREPRVKQEDGTSARKVIKLAVWTLVIAVALWASIVMLLTPAKDPWSQPTPKLIHRAMHRSGQAP